MQVEIAYPHIEKHPDVCGGKARVKGTRIRVLDIVAAAEHLGLSPNETCDQYPELNLAQVHTALAYYYDHKEEIRAEITKERLAVESFRRDHPDQISP